MTLWYPVMHPTQFLIYGYRHVCRVVMSQLNKLNMCLCGDVCVVECHVEWCTYAELLWSCVHMLMPFSTSVIKMTTFLVGKHNFFPGAIVQFVPLKYIFYTMGYGLLVVFAACWGFGLTGVTAPACARVVGSHPACYIWFSNSLHTFRFFVTFRFQLNYSFNSLFSWVG